MKTRTVKFEIEDKPDHPAVTLAKAFGFILIFVYKVVKLSIIGLIKLAVLIQEKYYAKK